MRFGPFLTIASTAASTYDPAVLNLDLWVRANYSGVPWSGVASAGSSGSRSLVTMGTPAQDPTAGTAINGRTPANFPGVYLSSIFRVQASPSGVNNYFSTTGYSYGILLYINGIHNNQTSTLPLGSANNTQAIFSSSGGNYGLSMRSTTAPATGPFFLQCWHSASGTRNGVELSLSFTQWLYVQCIYDGTNISARTNSNSWTSAALGNGANDPNTLQIGISQDSSTQRGLNGMIADMFFTRTVLSQATFTNIVKNYINPRYSLAL